MAASFVCANYALASLSSSSEKSTRRVNFCCVFYATVLCVEKRRRNCMSRIKLSPRQEAWLADQHSHLTHKELADELGVCIDTLKRMLMRRGLQYFAGAKYQFREPPKTWRRPCARCGCTRTRPKFQYRCDKCHEREGSDDDFFEEAAYSAHHRNARTIRGGLPDFYYLEGLRPWAIHKKQRATNTRSTYPNTSTSSSTAQSNVSEPLYRAVAD